MPAWMRGTLDTVDRRESGARALKKSSWAKMFAHCIRRRSEEVDLTRPGYDSAPGFGPPSPAPARSQPRRWLSTRGDGGAREHFGEPFVALCSWRARSSIRRQRAPEMHKAQLVPAASAFRMRGGFAHRQLFRGERNS
jgi:hypothetical protein